MEGAAEQTGHFELLYLWSLPQSRIRELVTSYVEGRDDLDEALVTRKVTSDIDALNIHRTPINCLMLLRLVEQSFEDSPVNRTDMIGRVLTVLFLDFEKTPRYETRPGQKDCEHALGYFPNGCCVARCRHFLGLSSSRKRRSTARAN